MDEGSDEYEVVLFVMITDELDGNDRDDEDDDDDDTMPMMSWSWSCGVLLLIHAELLLHPGIHKSLASGCVQAFHVNYTMNVLLEIIGFILCEAAEI